MDKSRNADTRNAIDLIESAIDQIGLNDAEIVEKVGLAIGNHLDDDMLRYLLAGILRSVTDMNKCLSGELQNEAAALQAALDTLGQSPKIY